MIWNLSAQDTQIALMLGKLLTGTKKKREKMKVFFMLLINTLCFSAMSGGLEQRTSSQSLGITLAPHLEIRDNNSTL